MNIILLGPPGSGKGTQAKRLQDCFGFLQISTGEILRKAVSSNSTLGKKIKSTMDAGELISDKLVLEVIKDRFSVLDSKKGVVFDGFPRTVAQAEALEEMQRDRKDRINAVIMLDVKDDVLISRIQARAMDAGSGGPRSDDTVEILKNRLQAYRKWTEPMIHFYEERGLLKRIDGMQGISQVSAKVKSIIRLLTMIKSD